MHIHKLIIGLVMTLGVHFSNVSAQPVLPGEPLKQNAFPEILNIPDLFIRQGESVMLELDSLVQDKDHENYSLIWQISSNESNLTIDVNNLIGNVTIESESNFTGEEIPVFFTVRDDSSGIARDTINVTVFQNVPNMPGEPGKLNSPPKIIDLPKIIFSSGSSSELYLDTLATDKDNDILTLDWEISSEESNINIEIDEISRTVKFSNVDGFVSDDIPVVFKVTDDSLATDQVSTFLQVTQGLPGLPPEPGKFNASPVISSIDSIGFREDEFVTVGLDSLVRDIDDSDASIVWNISSEISEINIEYDYDLQTVKLSAPENFYGSNLPLSFTATDDSSASDTMNTFLYVLPVNDAPVIGDLPIFRLDEDAVLEVDLDTLVTDVDHEAADITWNIVVDSEALSDTVGYSFESTQTGLSIWDVDNDSLSITVKPTTRVATFLADRAFDRAVIPLMFTATDDSSASDLARTTLVTDPANAPPVVDIIRYQVNEDDTLALEREDFIANFSDSDGDALVNIRLDSLPSSGRLLLKGEPVGAGNPIGYDDLDSLYYHPNANYFGPDSLFWNGFDGIEYSAANSKVVLRVLPVNDAPVIGDLPIFRLDEDAVLEVDLDTLVTDVDHEAADITWNIVVDSEALSDTVGYSFESTQTGLSIWDVDNDSLSITVNPTTRVATFLADRAFDRAVIPLMFTATDDSSASDLARTTLVTDPANAPPVVDIIRYQVNEDDTLALEREDFIANFSDSDGDALVNIRLDSLPSSGRLLLKGEPVGAGNPIGYDDLDSLYYHPNANYFGPDSLFWNGFDGIEYSAANSKVVLRVLPVNDAPVIGDLPIFRLDEDAVLEVDLDTLVTDVDHEAADITWNIVVDSEALSDTVGYSFESTQTGLSIWDADNDSLSITVNPTTRVATFLADRAFDRAVIPLMFTATDDSSASDLARTTLVTDPANAPPVVDIIRYQVNEDDTLALEREDFIANFSDSDGDALVNIRLDSLPSSGRLLLKGEPVGAGNPIGYDDLDSLYYHPNANYFGPDSLFWNGFDGIEYSAANSKVVLRVLPVNDAPVIGDLPIFRLDEDAVLEVDLDTLVTDVDHEAADITWNIVVDSEALSDTVGYSFESTQTGLSIWDADNDSLSITVNPTTRVATFLADRVFDRAVIPLMFTATDDSSASDLARTTLVTDPANAPPVVDIIRYQVNEDDTLALEREDFIANFSDSDGDA